ncbi:Proteasome assembly chaperone [Zostera marina]|uniref:Proteasome assembly chaperone 2 n=1 Tax=Zostera marina TaxID=29655 RepID=A0A0K9NKL8_ZOSMR|nr:Proteasome assembly chaperone [Zostera marina]
MEFVLNEEGKNVDHHFPTLILPALSIGNVPQLSVDLLISSIPAHVVGYLDDPSILPCVGNNAYLPFPPGDLALPLQVYESPSHQLTIIQQRSPVIKGRMLDFAKNLADFSVSNGKSHVIILSSLDSGRKKMISSSDKDIYYISSKDETCVDCEKLGWKRLEEYDPSHTRWKYLSLLADGSAVMPQEGPFEDEDFGSDDDYYPSLPFAALFSCCKAKGLKVTCILSYCSEGDNIPDSFQLADAACKLLSLNPSEFSGSDNGGWLVPFSWSSVYGPPPDMTLF